MLVPLEDDAAQTDNRLGFGTKEAAHGMAKHLYVDVR